MEYVIFIGATLILAIGFPYWEPAGLARIPRGGRWLVWAGACAHLGGATAIGWSAGIGIGVAAGVLIPVAASALYGILFNPMARARRLRRRGRSASPALQ